MKNSLTLTLLLLASTIANAQNAAFMPPPVPVYAPAPAALNADFSHGVRIADFTIDVLTRTLKAQYIVAPELLASPAIVGASLTGLSRDRAESTLRELLAGQGFTLSKKGGVYYVRPDDTDELAKIDFAYRPKNRPLAYLTSIIEPLFPKLSFTYKRGATSNESQPGGSANRTDDGASVYSRLSKVDLDIFYARGSANDVERLKTVLGTVDTPIPRALIRAFVLEVTTSHKDGMGISVVANLLKNKLGLSLTRDPVTNFVSFKTSTIDIVASALDTDSNVRVLTSPSIVAQTGIQASLSVGNSVPTLGAIQHDSNGTSNQSVEYQDTGVILNVTPVIQDESIILAIDQQVSDALPTTTGVNTSPTLTKRQLVTSAPVHSGEWTILGGLTSEKNSHADDSIFGFTLGNSRDDTSTDIVVLLYVERV